MSTALKLKFTEAEYLARENASPYKSEFYQGEIFAMTGASPRHNRIKDNLIIRIGGLLWGKECQIFSSDQRVKVQETGYISYPDILIVCGEPQYDESDPYSIVNPKVIIEVLSPSTERRDRLLKYREYQHLPTLQEFVLVHQTHMVIERFTCSSDGAWRHQMVMGKEEDFTLESISASIPMKDVFQGVEIPEQVEDVEDSAGESK